DTNWKIACDTAADLEKPDGGIIRRLAIPIRKLDHVFDPGADRLYILNRPGDATGGVNISQGGVFPAGHKQRKILVRSGNHPTVRGIDLVKLFQPALTENVVTQLVRALCLIT